MSWEIDVRFGNLKKVLKTDVKPWKQVSLQHVSFSCYTFLYVSLYFMLSTCLCVSCSSLFCITSPLFLLFNCPSSITPFFYMCCLSFLLPSCLVHSPLPRFFLFSFFFFLPCPLILFSHPAFSLFHFNLLTLFYLPSPCLFPNSFLHSAPFLCFFLSCFLLGIVANKPCLQQLVN